MTHQKIINECLGYCIHRLREHPQCGISGFLKLDEVKKVRDEFKEGFLSSVEPDFINFDFGKNGKYKCELPKKGKIVSYTSVWLNCSVCGQKNTDGCLPECWMKNPATIKKHSEELRFKRVVLFCFGVIIGLLFWGLIV